tara:strand:- start:328 stop:510 length:183 start_codon:yes stop_codon:yes gene_type:complete
MTTNKEQKLTYYKNMLKGYETRGGYFRNVPENSLYDRHIVFFKEKIKELEEKQNEQTRKD